MNWICRGGADRCNSEGCIVDHEAVAVHHDKLHVVEQVQEVDADVKAMPLAELDAKGQEVQAAALLASRFLSLPGIMRASSTPASDKT